MTKVAITMKVGTIAFPLTKPGDFKAWIDTATKFLEEAKEQKLDLLLFPEYVTLALEDEATFRTWLLGQFQPLFSNFAKTNNMIIAGGTHKLDTNQMMIFLPDGSISTQDKINLIPSEPDIKKGKTLNIVTTNSGIKVGTTICYDSEFPELSRKLTKDGVTVLLCPSWTEKLDGFYRVRYCLHARSVENQLFAMHAPLVGSMIPYGVDENATGSAAILGPCDPLMPANGILAEGRLNEPGLITATLDFRKLEKVRSMGAVRTYRDFMKMTVF